MCTVTYLPVGEHHFILTSNRDETPERRAEMWQMEKTGAGETIHYPRDPLKGGTWFGISDRGRVACLLNGAFEPFQQDPGYIKSRGAVIPDFFRHTVGSPWAKTADFSSIAPFTLVTFDGVALSEVVWDGHEKHVRDLRMEEPHIWSSVTLYPPRVRKWRENLFLKWRKENPAYTREAIIQFHQSAGDGDSENALVMNRRERVKTLSITSIEVSLDGAALEHLNLDTQKRTSRHFHLHSITPQP